MAIFLQNRQCQYVCFLLIGAPGLQGREVFSDSCLEEHMCERSRPGPESSIDGEMHIGLLFNFLHC